LDEAVASCRTALKKRSLYDGQCVVVILIVEIPESSGKVTMPQITHDRSRWNPFLAEYIGFAVLGFKKVLSGYLGD